MTQKAVVTGLGSISPIGSDVPTIWENALTGVSGARSLEYDWVEKYELPVTFAAEVDRDAVAEKLSRIEIRRNDPATQYALISAREAWADAGLTDTEVDGERLAVAYGTGIGGVWSLLNAWDTLRERGPRRVMPLTVPMLMPNAAAAAISLDLGAQAGAMTTVAACASGNEALENALRLIQDGTADIVVTGGAEAAVHPMPMAGFAAMQALSKRNDDPQAASRPYDVDRDGFVLGEGAGAMVIESEAHAKARGARIYAELAGTAVTSDSHHITAPDPSGSGAGRAMSDAIKRAGIEPEDVTHINAHATSTPVGDVPEYTAIKSVFGDHTDDILVSATKSQSGHLLGASGALESILTVLAVHHRQAPVTINLDNQDPEIPLNVAVPGKDNSLKGESIVALNNSFGFGGHNTVSLFRSI